MERLTKYGDTSRENKVCCTHFMGKECSERLGHCTDNCPWEEAAWSKLAAYEDTGIEPEEIEKLCDMDRRAEKAEAGNKILFNIIADTQIDDYDLNHLHELVQADRDGRCVVLPVKVGESLWIHDRDGKPREMELDPPDIRCHCKEEDNLCMALCSAKNTGVCAKRLFNDGSDIGKTVFLTREAAEEALRRKQ